jgi:hypothetical protein
MKNNIGTLMWQAMNASSHRFRREAASVRTPEAAPNWEGTAMSLNLKPDNKFGVAV